MKFNTKSFLLPVALIGLAVPAHAAALVTYSDPGSTPAVSSTDLLAGLAPLVVGTGANVNWANEGVLGVPAINDGLTTGFATVGISQAAVDGGSSGDLVWNFASAKDLTTINLYFGWGGGREDVPVMKIYTSSNPLVSTGTGTAAVTDDIAGFSLLASTTTQAYDSNSQASITSDNANPLASNVRSLVIRFYKAENDYVGLREIDVIGVNAVPEPSAALLGGLGVLALLRRRRA